MTTESQLVRQPQAFSGGKAAEAGPPRVRTRMVGDAMPYRRIVIALLALAVLSPVALIVYQSFLSDAFFAPGSRLSLGAYQYVLTDSAFYEALWTTIIVAVGMTVVAVPTGAVLAFLLTRTDIRWKPFLEVAVLVPMFISSIVLAFGYTVSVGPSGFISLAVRQALGWLPWNLYTVAGIILVGGLGHVPYAYLYVSAAMRNLPTDLEEAARISGASIWRVSWDVTIPLVLPALVFVTALNLLVGFEMFGVPLVLGDPNHISVLTTYIYKLTTLFGVPTYQMMAVVAIVIVVLTLPLIFCQRHLLRNGRRYATLGGKGARSTPLRLGAKGQAIALTIIGLWIFVSVVLPIGGIVLRTFVSAWGVDINLFSHLTMANFAAIAEIPSLQRTVLNTVLLAAVGGAAAVVIYLLIALAGHRNTGPSNTLLDYMVLLPRALPGLVVGLAFFWLFLFVPFLRPFRPTLVALFVAYLIVGLSYGLRLLQGVLIQVEPELEEAARTTGATIGQTWRDVVMPIVRPGLLGAWVLIMIIFIRDEATGVYLIGSGTEVIGPEMVTLLQTGAMDTIAALSFVSIILTGVGLGLALRLGARFHE